MRARRVFLAGLGLVVACSSAGGGAAGSGTTSTQARRGNANLISSAEIAELGGSVENAFDLVERLRPTMMRSRASTFGAARSDGSQGGASINVIAYQDEVRLGEVATLRSVPATAVLEIRYISATDATQRWGTGVGSGVIQVITKK